MARPRRNIIQFPKPRQLELAERDDDELVLLARGGVPPAFDVLVRRYQTFALRTAAKYLGNAAAAKDVAQDTFVAVYHALPRYEPRGQFRAYLRKVLVNHCRMAHRRARRRPTVALDGIELLGDDEVLRRERVRDVERAVATLSPRLRIVVVLRFAGDMSHREIAETLDLPVGTVKSRLFAGLAKLRSALE